MNFYKPMQEATTTNWTRDEEEIISFFTELIPLLQEIKVDLEAKNMLGKEFLVARGSPACPSLQT